MLLLNEIRSISCQFLPKSVAFYIVNLIGLQLLYFFTVPNTNAKLKQVCFFYKAPIELRGNVHRILLHNKPIFTKQQENTHNEGKRIWNFSTLIICSVTGRGILESLYPYEAH